MNGGFNNPIAGGQGVLLRPAVKSPDYQPGVSGWTINRDGSAEFNNVTVRGTIEVTGDGDSKITILNVAGVPVIELWADVTSGAPNVNGAILENYFAGGGQLSLQLFSGTLNGGHDAKLYLIAENEAGTEESQALFHVRRAFVIQSDFGQTDGISLDVESGGILSVFGGLKIGTGVNKQFGRSTLVAGTVVVATNKVTANSNIFLTCQVPGGTPGFLRVSTRVVGTSFTILSSNAADTSQVAWLLIEPA